MLATLQIWDLKQIMKYIGDINKEDKYYVKDNCSKNGSYWHLN